MGNISCASPKPENNAMSRPRSIVSILVWDSHTYTKNLLANMDWAPPGNNTWTYILDQGSDAPTRDLLRDYVPKRTNISARLLGENIGYSAGHNLNYKLALQDGRDFDYFITVNSDIAFGEPLWVDQMVDAMEANPKAALGGPFGYKQCEGYIAPCSVAEMRAGRFLFITGAVTIVRARAVRQCGLFDEVYSPAYYEDQDMVNRYQHFGWEQIFTDIPVVHGYLGEMEKVNRQKREDLKLRHGDFALRNQHTFTRRWVGPNRLSATSSPLDWGDTLYIP